VREKLLATYIQIGVARECRHAAVLPTLRFSRDIGLVLTTLAGFWAYVIFSFLTVIYGQ